MLDDILEKKTDVAEELRSMVDRLVQVGVTNAPWEARQMMAFVLKESPVLLPLRSREDLPAGQCEVLEKMLLGRLNRRPLAHVLGEWDFGGMRLGITPNVLVPRPETEEFLGFIIRELGGSDNAKSQGFVSASRRPGVPASCLSCDGESFSKVMSIADIGTGSGCLAMSLATHFPRAFVWAVDVSPSALVVARRNAEGQGVARRIFFLEGDLLSSLSPAVYVDVIVANLPYVDETDMDGLSPEVRHEPSLALNGGTGGVDLIRRLIAQTRGRLPRGGKLFLEIGHDQAERVKGFLSGAGYKKILSGRDFAGVERFVMGEK